MDYFPSGITPATLRDGDPRTFDRELFGRLTGPERWAAVRRYVIRIGPGYRSNRRFPDDEAAASVARGSVLSGLWSLGVCLAGLWTMAMPGLFVFVALLGATDLQSVSTATLLIVCYIGAVASVVLVALRARQINGWFVERYPALGGRHFWRPLRNAEP